MRIALLTTLLCASALVAQAQPAAPTKAAKPAASSKAATPAAPPSASQLALDDIKATLGFVPKFLGSVPEAALPGAWEEMKGLQMNPSTVLPGKIKELIGLAVAAQVPCSYCVYAHTKFAELGGATKAETGEAVILAALARHWSTVLQGNQTDLAKFKADVAKLVQHAKASAGKPMPAAINVTDAASARKQIEQMFGSVPEFMSRYAPAGFVGAWKEMRDVQLSPTTSLSSKHKSLIGLAVASQVPCAYCVVADTEFAKLAGATDAEIQEAIAMAAITRHWSTYLNGTQQDDGQFRRDIDKLVSNVKKQQAAAVAAAKAAEKKAAADAAKAAREAEKAAKAAEKAAAKAAKAAPATAATPATPAAPVASAKAVTPATPAAGQAKGQAAK
jgi:AhpD family alkylhydroperoxidase